MWLFSILRVLGLLLALFSATMLPPLFLSLLTGDGQQLPFLAATALILGGGLLLWASCRHSRRELRTRDGFLVVTLYWLVVALAGAVPLMLASAPHMGLTDAMFESMSGLTTTGATVLSGIDDLPVSIRYYRQQLNWLGGMGIVVLAVAVLPMLGVGGMQLYRAEMPGPLKEDKLTPRIAETAKALWYIYLGLTAACALAYWFGGMSAFDAVGHSFSTISTGGFSTHDASMGYFDSPVLDLIGSVFMILSGLNFALHYLAWRRRSLRPYLTDPENVFYLKLLLVALCIVGGGLYLAYGMGLGESLRHGLFQLATFSTNTGLATTSYYQWPGFVLVLLMFISCIGGAAGSTAGGMKVMRFLLLFKQGMREIARLVHPRAQLPVKLGEVAVAPGITSAVWAFLALYVAMFALFMLILMATGVEPFTAFSAVVATINNLGIGAGDVSAGFGHLAPLAKWTLVMSMLMGRLEIFTVIVLFFPAFWRR